MQYVRSITDRHKGREWDDIAAVNAVSAIPGGMADEGLFGFEEVKLINGGVDVD